MTKILRVLSVTATIASMTTPVFAVQDFPAVAPIPYQKPGRQASAAALSYEVTGAISPGLTTPASTSLLKQGMDALSDGDGAKAIQIRNRISPASLDHQILSWAIATSGDNDIPSSEIAAAQQELKGWPGLSSLRAYSEHALYRENPDPRAVIAAFGNSVPETSDGTILLTRAYLATGDTKRAHATLARIWTSWALDTSTENRILGEFGSLLTREDNKERMVYLLYRDRATQAERFSDLGNAQSFYKAWAAVIRGSSNAGALIKAVDRSWYTDPGFLYIQIRYARSQNQMDTAAALLKKMPKNQAALVNPDQWWDEQRIVSRDFYEDGKPKQAYAIVAEAMPEDRLDRLDADFHAGWYALRGLNNGKLAMPYFQQIAAESDSPISQARAYYWMGRAAEAGGPGSAKSYYQKSASYATTFYGQLSLQKLGQKQLEVVYPSPTQTDRANFEKIPAVQAIKRLESIGYSAKADGLYLSLAYQLKTPGEVAILSYRAETDRSYQLSLQIGKIAYARGLDVAALAFPTGVIPDTANISGSGKALAYAIARQESAFNPQAVSAADARGLLQLLPSTAQKVAAANGLAYSKAKLTSDAGYNATLGAHYLGEQIDRFGGSYVLTFVAYNAGPARVPQWIDRFGDPRGQSLDDVVDWIESIPYPETRNYVQRVMENYEVYKARLGEPSNIAYDLVNGRQ
ncbi:lytic transglycosylase domain-containing protein [Martelella sp. HB161492]|uniref:lytic transglycosylase domain-containing protein n=1 Tax=Martelella sp. HB161492 TaxID=2720726 RepID=UPI001590F0BC|nr:lytic transglycosylase domain-containing protein [Martelella sp. HB161492]